MSFKKFALLFLTVVVFSGLSMRPVAAATEETESSVVLSEEVDMDAEEASGEAEQGETEDAEQEEKADSDEEGISTSVKTSVSVKTSTSKKAANKENYTAAELRLMASIINCEAGGEGFQGKIAVGIVVMNRVESSAFPNTIKKVIYQKNQFSPVRNGMLDQKLKQYDAGKTGSEQWKSCISAAKKVLNGQRTIVYKGKVKNMKGYYFFSVVLPGARIKIGGHRFK